MKLVRILRTHLAKWMIEFFKTNLDHVDGSIKSL